MYFPANSESSGYISDSTGNGNTGTLVRSASVSTDSYRFGAGSVLFASGQYLSVSSFETTSSAGTVSACAHQARAVSYPQSAPAFTLTLTPTLTLTRTLTLTLT